MSRIAPNGARVLSRQVLGEVVRPIIAGKLAAEGFPLWGRGAGVLFPVIESGAGYNCYLLYRSTSDSVKLPGIGHKIRDLFLIRFVV
ncbi:hypothetical protein D3H35_27815 [Cohnella faecalis]|uniref:Uncharacterized protein n=1 Tax=Cohnella faecalis TaxID=2315694 RepID=A0A398CCW2_9BACL|nr:hypothetical protein D3H35_27815 [Cohnella faecalis]